MKQEKRPLKNIRKNFRNKNNSKMLKPMKSWKNKQIQL